MKKTSLSALVAAGLLAGGLPMTNAFAADLGGNCCADLEERIAELEATTARKGNRKVSLTVSGFVAQQVLAWDDGEERNVYITDTGSVSIGTHFKFSGEAKIREGLTAGYVLNIEAIQDDLAAHEPAQRRSGGERPGLGRQPLDEPGGDRELLLVPQERPPRPRLGGHAVVGRRQPGDPRRRLGLAGAGQLRSL